MLCLSQVTKLCDEHAINSAYVMVGFVKYVVEPLVLPIIRFAGMKLFQGCGDPLVQLQRNLDANLEYWLAQPGAEALEAADYDRSMDTNRRSSNILPPNADFTPGTQRRSISLLERKLSPLRASFRNRRVNSVAEADIREFIEESDMLSGPDAT